MLWSPSEIMNSEDGSSTVRARLVGTHIPSSNKRNDQLVKRQEAREHYIATHSLVLANPAPVDSISAVARLQLLKNAMAREVAAMEFNKYNKDLEGKDTTALSSKIVLTLGKMADLDLEIKKLGHVVIDPKSEEVQKMASLWVKTLMDVLVELVKDGVLESQTMDLLSSKFATALEGWEDKVESGDLEG